MPDIKNRTNNLRSITIALSSKVANIPQILLYNPFLDLPHFPD